MAKGLEGKRVAIVATDLVEQAELVEPRQALEDAGAETDLVSLGSGSIQGVNHDQKADSHTVDRTFAEASADDYDALLIPGGVGNPDRLRTDADAVAFVEAFHASGKPIAAICHGPWMLIEAGIASGRTLTSWPSLKTDIRNAGGTWVDREVVNDNGVVTSRKPDDIPAFNETMIAAFAAAPARPRNAKGAGRN